MGFPFKIEAQNTKLSNEEVAEKEQTFADLARIKEQLAKAKSYLFIENVDSASVVVSPLIDELSSMNLLNSPLGLEVRLIKVNTLELNNARGEALEEIFLLIEDCKIQKEWLTLSRTYLVAELAYEFLNKPERCLFYFKQCQATIEEHELAYNYPRFCNRFSSYHRIWGDRDSSYYYAEEALRTSKLIYQSQENNPAKEMYEDISSEYATAHTILGGLYRRETDLEKTRYHFDKAKYHFEQAKLIWQKAGNDFATTWTFLHLSWLYSGRNDYKTALLYNDTSLIYGEVIYDKWGILGKELRSNTLLSRAKLYENLNQQDSAYQFIHEGYQEKIKVIEARNHLHATEIEARNTDKQKAFKIEQQNEQLDREGKLRLGLIGVLAVFFLLSIGLIYFYLQLRKANRKTKIQAEELKVLDKVKSNFFANISHELRTPLTLILGPLSYILDNPAAWEQQKVQEQLTVMQRNGRSLMDLIEEILDLSKLEANKLELQEEATSVQQFFERIFAIFEPQFDAQGLQGQLDISLHNNELTILLDRKKTEKVINNFLSNAIKFTFKGGQIKLSVKETENNIDIVVKDNGKGIHPNDLPFIFDRFYQSKQANQKMYGGTGIGLALVQEFAQLMGGRAYAESTLGVGSSFHFSLPKKIANLTSEWKHTSALLLEEETLINIEGDFCVLVVEDNTDMRQFICQLLSEKYEVLSAKNGAEGLDVLAEHHQKIDIIVSDVMMPELDGLSLLSKIKTHLDWHKIPVVMLTALAAERDKLKALMIGVDDYLTKPFSVTELTVRIQNLLYNAHQRKLAQKQLQEETITEIEKEVSKTDVIQKEWVDKVETIILSSIKEEEIASVELLSKKLFLSVRQVQRKIKLATGFTPKQFIQEVQLQMARKTFEEEVILSVAEVAYKTGFESPRNFSRVYKKRFGRLPSSYLK